MTNKDKLERNKAIYINYIAGASMEQLAIKYKLSFWQIQRIIKKEGENHA